MLMWEFQSSSGSTIRLLLMEIAHSLRSHYFQFGDAAALMIECVDWTVCVEQDGRE